MFLITKNWKIHRWKRRFFPFKILFISSRYDYPFPRYRRSKRNVIFNVSPIVVSLARSNLLVALLPWPASGAAPVRWSATNNWVSAFLFFFLVSLLAMSSITHFQEKTTRSWCIRTSLTRLQYFIRCSLKFRISGTDWRIEMKQKAF